jgi:L,D-peptidoglycan transpeptidase YkuD (ErfK/YbiS/YcfS/YnhG family)
MKGKILLALSLIIGLAVTGCEKAPPPQPTCEQIVEVRGRVDDFHASLVCMEKQNGSWVRILDCPATIGKNGIIRGDLKVEGDGKTPDGIYKLERAFGYAETIETGLAYQPVTGLDIWIDDPESPDYNLRKMKPTTAKSFEELRRKDGLYEYAAVIEYNTKNIKKGAGSAIFFHAWGGADAPTAGCVSIERWKLIAILKWLDAKKKPIMTITFGDAKNALIP